MSILHTHEVTCDCGAVVAMMCCDSLNAERHPHLREALLERTLHRFQCGGCGAFLVADKRMMYVDLERGHFYGVGREADRGDERALADELLTAWRISLGDEAPASVLALFEPGRFHVRLCFGLEELREKVVAREAGIDDLALEIFKGELLAANPEWAGAGVRTLRLDHVEPDGRLALYLERAGDPPVALELGLVSARERCDELARARWQDLLATHPSLASGPHVSLLRLGQPEMG
jgi:hypothetical protein